MSDIKISVLKHGESIVLADIEEEPEFSKGYGYERYEMSADDLTALLRKKMIFIQVQGEYTVGIVLVANKENSEE